MYSPSKKQKGDTPYMSVSTSDQMSFTSFIEKNTNSFKEAGGVWD